MHPLKNRGSLPFHHVPVRALLLCAIFAVFLLPRGALAQTQRSGGGASSQIMQQYQQLASERTALQAENAKLKADAEALTKERDALKKERDALKARGPGDGSSAKAVAAAQVAEQELAQQRKKMEELIARYRETATNLADVEKQRGELAAQNARVTQQVGECADRNAKLRELANDVLTRYEHTGTLSKLTLDEPFTRITRTRLENYADEARAEANALKVAAPAQ